MLPVIPDADAGSPPTLTTELEYMVLESNGIACTFFDAVVGRRASS